MCMSVFAPLPGSCRIFSEKKEKERERGRERAHSLLISMAGHWYAIFSSPWAICAFSRRPQAPARKVWQLRTNFHWLLKLVVNASLNVSNRFLGSTTTALWGLLLMLVQISMQKQCCNSIMVEVGFSWCFHWVLTFMAQTEGLTVIVTVCYWVFRNFICSISHMMIP